MQPRQSLAEIEQAFLEQVEMGHRDQLRRQRSAEIQSRKRWHARERKRSSLRFYVLSASLVLTGALVTAAMLVTLYLLLS
jgi:hypothetical protein